MACMDYSHSSSWSFTNRQKVKASVYCRLTPKPSNATFPQLAQMPCRKTNDEPNYWLETQVYLLVIFKLIKDILGQIRMTV